MHPAFWKGLTALLILYVLGQHLGVRDRALQYHNKQRLTEQKPSHYHAHNTRPAKNSTWTYHWKEHRNNHALTDEQCDAAFPDLYFEIDRAASYWATRELNTQSLELYEGNEAGVRAHLEEGQLRIVQTRGMWREDFRQRIIAVLHQIYRALVAVESSEPFQDTEFTFVVDDFPLFPSNDSSQSAVFSFARNVKIESHEAVWLMPDFNFWAAVPSAGAFAEMQARARSHDARIEDKEQRLVWRGVEWTNPELRGALLNASVGRPWADVKSMTWGDTTKFLSLDEHCRYAFVVNTEGRSWSSRLTHLLNCDSVPVIHDMEWTAHYYHLLDAGVNYVPVRRDFSDLEKQIEYHLAHPQTSQRISDAARTTFRERYTSPAAEACYWRKLLRTWSGIAPRPERTPSIVFEEFLLHDNGKDYPYE
ncbi:hypothetical protein KC332_g355 [Hortaea werneckii]|uniref:Glycosyl transferase CAP10 domain-containing protein n=2 Tax=Hortaea werneckii TaxID=91943 RepID=A0A1Z5TFU5_HORWE|nr:hypothetical protein KC358_g11313 [Hortaea werneckii]OTA34888.1 hypothetical protein BTJ68_05592 [Hortaea werneckii EXF-2000]KAI6852835.1 hypothetical protein KC350_g524 [Hortaea werneckii]KAI6943967.1 hypothetical protein KC341_g1130 [Hortaea werneckii]KAI6950890.1 hypothetical protein KC348_g382 [Hortaea werneckii]